MRRSRKKRKHVNILPSLLTIGNMYCGLLSIVYTINGEFSHAAWMIILALLFDISDGSIARLTNSTSNFGKELDSLADIVTFGVSPAVLVYRSILYNFQHIGIFLVTVYAITGATDTAPESRNGVAPTNIPNNIAEGICQDGFWLGEGLTLPTSFPAILLQYNQHAYTMRYL